MVRNQKPIRDYQSELDDIVKNRDRYAMSGFLNNIKYLAKAYSKIQRDRVAYELTLQSYENKFMLSNGLAVLETTITDVPVTNKDGTVLLEKRKGHKTIPLYEKEEDKNKKLAMETVTNKRIEAFKEEDIIYKMVQSYRNTLFQQEKQILSDGVALLSNSEVSKWCRKVKGLGDVAAMSFSGYIDPTHPKSPTLGHVLSYLGIVPGKAMRRGSQGKYNKKIKSVFIGIIAPNVIRSGDSYYKGIYNIKKEYHLQRPDLVHLAEQGMKGWKGWINNMSIRVLTKILISHAFDLLKVDYGMINYLPEITHHNPLPVKPDFFDEEQKILRGYKLYQEQLLQKLKLAWANDPTEGKTEYREILKYGTPRTVDERLKEKHTNGDANIDHHVTNLDAEPITDETTETESTIDANLADNDNDDKFDINGNSV